MASKHTETEKDLKLVENRTSNVTRGLPLMRVFFMEVVFALNDVAKMK